MQVASANGEVIITNDGATILAKMTVTQPAAKMLVELSKSQVSLVRDSRVYSVPDHLRSILSHSRRSMSTTLMAVVV